MRRMSMFPTSGPDQLAFTEDAIRDEMENGKSPRWVSDYSCGCVQCKV